MARGYGYEDAWAPYIPVAERRRQAERKAADLKKKGQACQPVVITGRGIASSFWGKAWCDNLEAYSDHANRLPRGRTYVRNGSVIDLQIDTGRIQALVSGSDVYRVAITVQPLEAARWKAIVTACAGQVASLIEVLQGRISKAVMAVVTHPGTGLFPASRQLQFSCSCPDGARMCKHVAATLYGVGARLDHEPELLFKLRHVSAVDLLSQGAQVPAAGLAGGATKDVLADADLSALFGIDLGDGSSPPADQVPPAPVAVTTKTTARKAGTKTTARKASATTSAAELLARGVPRHMIQSWLQAGVLLPGKKRGAYRCTRHTEPRIKAYLARGSET